MPRQVSAKCLKARWPLTIRERFDVKWAEDTETGCWRWKAFLNNAGYGTFCWKAPGHSRKYSHGAHRVAWELYRGPIPDGMYIDHVCRVRCCVNPDHLRVVTHRLNNIENSLCPPALNAQKICCPKCGSAYMTRTKRTGKTGRECLPCRNRKARERWPERREKDNARRMKYYHEHKEVELARIARWQAANRVALSERGRKARAETR